MSVYPLPQGVIRNPAGLPGSQELEPGPWFNFPPWFFPPRGAFIVQQANGAVIGPAGSSVDLLQVDPGPGHMLRISQLGFGASDPTALTNAVFTITQRGNIVQGWGSTTIAIGTLDRPAEVIILPPETGLVTLSITNNAPLSSYVFFARWVGWTFVMAGAS